MSYSQFTTIGKVKEAFGIQTIEGVRFLPEISPIAPSQTLSEVLNQNLAVAAVGSEKARSELIISPVLMEVRQILKQEISLFSGVDFTVNAELGLNGICDFLLSRSRELMEIEAPAVMLVEAKKADLSSGVGQCIAEMIAAQQFNHAKGRSIPIIYGIVTSGMQWRLMQLIDQIVTIDLMDYSLFPVEQLLANLVWMLRDQ